jgi:DNA-binding transcriptional regulator LsrR (DeoR family)
VSDHVPSRRDAQSGRLDQAARAAWLYYIGGRTQDEIANVLGLSRQAVQRLISLAVSEKLIKFRLDHPIAACVALGEALTARFGLMACEVVPLDGSDPDSLGSLAVAAAAMLERWLMQRAPHVLALGTGRTLRAVAAELPPMQAPQHKVLSLCGTTAVDGRAGLLEPVIRVAERTGAQCYPMPSPVIAATPEECRLTRSQRSWRTLAALLAEARCVMVGFGQIGWRCPLHADGFVTDRELTEIIEAGGVGEIAGWPFDADGRPIATSLHDRINGLSVGGLSPGREDPQGPPGRAVVGVGGGPRKRAAIAAALRGGLVNCLITDELTAQTLLEPA